MLIQINMDRRIILKSVLMFFIYAILGGIGLTILKKGLSINNSTLFSLLNINTIIGGIIYVISFLIWIIILKSTDLTFAFPIASGALFASILLFSFLFLKDDLSYLRIVGILIILIGIFISSRG